MRLIVFDLDSPARKKFYPLSLSRPLFDLRVGMTTLAEKWVAHIQADDVAYFVPEYLSETYKERADKPVNDLAALSGDDLLLVDGRLKVDAVSSDNSDSSRILLGEEGEAVLLRITEADARGLDKTSLRAFLESALKKIGPAENIAAAATWNYPWDLILANADELIRDFERLGRKGVEGTLEEQVAVRGSEDDLFVAAGAVVHPMVVLDTTGGPIYLDEEVEVQPFTRIEGPCYVGKGSILLGAKCRRGMSIGPASRVGGEVEESILHGYANKYHDGFLGHSYVGEWVNLGALTTNSDLKNDYTNVDVTLDGRSLVDTGTPKMGALVGDHAKTAIGTLVNTGTTIGPMTIIASGGRPLPKFIPAFTWFLDGTVSKGFGKRKLYTTAAQAMPRRGREWTQGEERLWDAVFALTKEERQDALKKARTASG